MAYFMTTPLGRSVRRSDWDAFHQDTILKLLYGDSDGEQRDITLALTALEIATGQSEAKLAALCAALVEDKLIELGVNHGGIHVARLTAPGRTEVGQRLAFLRLLARLSEL